IEAARKQAKETTPAFLFRGLTAAASLKHVVLDEIGRMPGFPLPRPHRRGLIEAMPTSAPPCPAQSRALPRPHRRGLIEAAHLSLSFSASSISSAASPPRPH